ncbi:hypothetical protein B0T16DRAFT_21192 [Cercophora newfieldiana]|uniref:Zn(2)-C6 fungal-type domain-containing protein n=1 Tax=Cercophora newfieldiana TaxID=92897 RepID=A0AA39YNS2_9PEZI|nr:hypothetical protein B0T16DRAFT_21192 [Cercophora newfieldiana]
MADSTRPRPQKRRRPALACEQCRARKVRCDRASPCSTCLRTDSPGCTYTSQLPPGSGGGGRPVALASQVTPRSSDPTSSAIFQPPSATIAPGKAQASGLVLSPSSPDGPAFALTPSASSTLASSAAVIASLELRVKQLEKQVQLSQQLGAEQAEPPDEITPDPRETEKNFVPLRIRGTMSKTRFFGHSHWSSGANMIPLKALIQLMDRAQHEKTSKIYAGFQKCKVLARHIKKQRIPHLSALGIGQNVPDRPVVDHLVDGYFRTFETIYRVLHIPSFRTEYERYWLEPKATSLSFVILMQLCMAVGACFHDDKHSLRVQATGWIYEARLWLLTSSEKSQLSLVGLQILCLLQLAKQTTGLAGDLTWISAGSLLRAAMAMGLQHDPENLVRMPPLRAELRRRLWVTILEINLQASLDAGALPLISPHDFGTRPPQNLNEEELSGETTEHLASATGITSYTQTSAQIALFQSFTTRLAIVNHVNQSKPPEYEDTLQISADLITSARTLMQQLHAHPRDEQGIYGVSNFQLRFLEMTMNRYLLALHLPWWKKAPTVHYYSRKAGVEAARSLAALHNIGPNPSPSLTDFDRLLVCGAGPFRSTPVNACLTLTLEYIRLKEEEQNNKGMTTTVASARETAELHAIFDWQTEWWARRIRAGETNIKSYAFGQVFDSLMEALEANLGPEEAMALVTEQAISRIEECYEMLKETAGGVGIDVENVPVEGQQEPLDDELLEVDPMDYSFLDDLEWNESIAGLNTFDLLFK